MPLHRLQGLNEVIESSALGLICLQVLVLDPSAVAGQSFGPPRKILPGAEAKLNGEATGQRATILAQ
jgi:hypothetical protein